MASKAIEQWIELFKKMDTTAARRGDEWTKPIAEWIVNYDYQEPADAMGVKLTDLARNGLSEAQIAVVVRVMEKVSAQGKPAQKHNRCFRKSDGESNGRC